MINLKNKDVFRLFFTINLFIKIVNSKEFKKKKIMNL